MNRQKHLLVICGATASGKTEWAIRIAQLYKTVILSADSRQFYQEMSIGTAKPSEAQLNAVPHYFINSHSILDTYTAGQYEREALTLLDRLFQSHEVVVMVGGSGLFIKAVCEGFDSFDTTDSPAMPELLDALPTLSIEQMQAGLKLHDPDYYAQVDTSNPRRLQRALEVIYTTGLPYSTQRTAAIATRPFRIVKLGIDMDKAVLQTRIDTRVDRMMEAGLLAEAEVLYPLRHLNPLQTVGYQELFDYMDGKHTLPQAIALIKTHSRQYAKRQMTWFKKDGEIRRMKGWME